MADNLILNIPDFYVPIAGGTPAALGFTSGNTFIIYASNGAGGFNSHNPAVGINSLTTIVEGEGILVSPKTSREDTNLVGGGVVPGSGGGAALPTPGSPTATALSDTEIDVDWTASAGATGYIVDRATNAGFTTGVSLGVFVGSATIFNDTGRTAETQYFYRIAAVASGATNSAYATANATTEASDALENIIFEDTSGSHDPGVNIEDVGGNIWEVVDSAAGPHRGRDTNRKLVGDGYIQAEIDGTHKDGTFGLRIDETTEELANTYKVGFNHATDPPDNACYQLDAGGTGELAITTYLPVIGDWVRIIRTGTQFKLQKSSNSGGLWTDVHTYVYTSAADMYIVCSIVGAGGLVHPKGFGLTAY